MSEPSRAQQANLRILSTTDVHTHLLPYDYFGDKEARGPALATAAALIRRERAAAPNCLLLDNGDFLQGTPLSEMPVDKAEAHPAILAMNTLGYDAATLGNHEFDYGLPVLEAAIAAAEFPFVLANVRRRGGKAFVPPWTILTRRLRLADGREVPLAIGLIGVTPPQVTDWDSAVLGDTLETECILAAARREVPRLRAAGADIVIALCHSGIAGAAEVARMENAAIPLASIDGIDALITGHTHQVFPGPQIAATALVDPKRGTLCGKPAVMAGHNASHIGRIDLTLERSDPNQQWRLADHRVSALATDLAAPPDPALVTALKPAHAQALRQIRAPIGHSATRIESYFALIGPSTAIQVLADAQRRYVAGAAPELADLPLISVASASRAGGRGGADNYVDIPAGPLTRGAAAALSPYSNPLCVLELNGRALRDWLERSASLFRQIPQGATPGPLLLPGATGYNFDVLDGLTYTVDLRKAPRFDADGLILDEAAGRICDLARDGAPVTEDQRFLAITNTFRAAGGGRFRAAQAAKVVYQSPLSTQEIVADYMGRENPLVVCPHATWRFACDATRTLATFDTGPGALDLATPAALPGMRHIGPGASGFERFEVPL